MHKKAGILCVISGAFLILAALGLVLYNHLEASHAAKASDSALSKLLSINPETESGLIQDMDKWPSVKTPSAGISTPNISTSEMPVAEIDGYSYIGYLSIPALGLELPVMADWDYTRMKLAPCLYFGSIETNNLVIAGHNFDRHFGRLPNLKTGDIVCFTSVEGIVYTYRVVEIETLPPTAVKEMIDSGWALSLYTCTYSGSERVTVRCERA